MSPGRSVSALGRCRRRSTGLRPGWMIGPYAEEGEPPMVLADAVDRDRLVATFLELVAIDSPTGHEEKIGRELTARFGELGCQVAQDAVGNLLAVLPGAYADTVLVATQ
jgi:hypothetical protein